MDDALKTSFVQLLLAAADDRFILGHRMADWTGLAPILEEDIAFSAIAQEALGHAAALYEIASDMTGVAADDLAYGRKTEEYRCAPIIEMADDFDWAVATTRQFLCDHFDALRLERMTASSHQPLAALSRRMLAETRLQLEHADDWMVRLGRGSPESHRRMQGALDRLVRPAAMLFEPVEGQSALETAGLYPPGHDDMFVRWTGEVGRVVTAAGLAATFQPPSPHERGGRRGRHSDSFVALLDELCEVYRLDPGAAW